MSQNFAKIIKNQNNFKLNVEKSKKSMILKIHVIYRNKFLFNPDNKIIDTKLIRF